VHCERIFGKHQRMSSILTLVFAAISLAVLVILVLATQKPNEFRATRKLAMQAPPEAILALVLDFHKWPSWSPWEKLDPNMQRTFSGAESGVGAVYEWIGTGKAGAGRMEVLTVESHRVVVKLDFIKPFEGHNTAEFSVSESAGEQLLSWTMYGPNQFMSKVMSVLVDMDKLIGKDFEAGLANMKAVVETRS
jgi:Polyketide cyclase / dehydrase and lipid transport